MLLIRDVEFVFSQIRTSFNISKAVGYKVKTMQSLAALYTEVREILANSSPTLPNSSRRGLKLHSMY